MRRNPPFLEKIIELVVPVEPCKEYNFEVRFVSHQNEDIGKITDLKLESLANLKNYIPPLLTSVVLIKYIAGGKQIVTTQPSSPVPDSCLPNYFEAIDTFANKLESVANVQEKINIDSQYIQFREQQNVELTQADFLSRQGCVCSSPRLELRILGNGTNQMVYLYEGIWEGKPFYKLDRFKQSWSRPVQSKGFRKKRFIGRVDGGGTTSTRRPWNYSVNGPSRGRPWTNERNRGSSGLSTLNNRDSISSSPVPKNGKRGLSISTTAIPEKEKKKLFFLSITLNVLVGSIVIKYHVQKSITCIYSNL